MLLLKPYELLFLEFESFVKDLIGIGKKVHPIILSVTCHSFRSFSPTHTQPLISICEFSKPFKLVGVGHEGCGGSYRGGMGWSGSYRGGVGWVGSCWVGVGHAGVGGSYRGGMGHAVRQPKKMIGHI